MEITGGIGTHHRPARLGDVLTVMLSHPGQ
jgi:hypothetical protein